MALPTGYIELEYIESSGTQYIDTGFKPNQDTRVKIDFVQPNAKKETARYIVSASDGTNTYQVMSQYGGTQIYDYYGGNNKIVDGVNTYERLTIDKNRNVLAANGVTNTSDYQKFNIPYNLYIFAQNSKGNTDSKRMVPGMLYSCEIYDNDVLVRDFIPVKDHSGNIGLYDLVSGVFYGNAGGGEFTAGPEKSGLSTQGVKLKAIADAIREKDGTTASIPANTFADRILALSVGVQNPSVTLPAASTQGEQLARIADAIRVKEGSTGVIPANQFASRILALIPLEKKLVYYGTISPLSEGRFSLGATIVGNYAIFFNGRKSNSNYTCSSSVDAYNVSLTKVNITTGGGYGDMASASIGNYALFAGGLYSSGSGYNQSSYVFAYDNSLTRSNPTSLSQKRNDLAATSVGNYALFGGGFADLNPVGTVNAYNASLTRSTPTALSVARYGLAATTVGNYALFGGGRGKSSIYVTVDAYDNSLTRSSPTTFASSAYGLAATSVGNYALFAGGYNYKNQVTSYDESLTRGTPEVLSVGRRTCGATTVGDFALFGGGHNGTTATNSVEAYSNSLVRSAPTSLSQARNELSATTVGNYALFAGGLDANNANSSVVDVYTIQ